MGRVVIPGVVSIKGALFFRRRHRRPDGTRKAEYHPLPAADHPDFAAALARAKGDAAPTRRSAPQSGTMAYLAHAFRCDLPRRRNRHGKPLSERTVANYRLYVERIERDHGDERILDLTTKICGEIQEGMADTPGTANNYMAVLRDMMALACRKGWAKHNPVREIKALRLGEHEPWPESVISAVLRTATPMTRLAVISYLCSGQRGGDVIRMQHGWHDRRIMQFKQGKSQVMTAFPMHPIWIAEIDALPRRAVTILYDRFGRPFKLLATLRERINDALLHPQVVAEIEAAYEREELPAGASLSPHGLRKNAACYLMEAGADETEIGALCGMGPDMVRHYTKRVQVRRIAERMAAGVSSLVVPGLNGRRP